MATNFLWYSGSTPYNGILTSSGVTIVGSAQTDTSVFLSSYTVSNSTTTFTSSYFGQAIYGVMTLTLGSTNYSPIAAAAGGNICGWFLQSQDGTNFEKITSSLPSIGRPPNFIIPLTTYGATASQQFLASGLVQIPATKFQVAIQNNTSQTFASTGAYISLAPIAMQY